MVSVRATGDTLRKYTSATIVMVALSLLGGCASTKVAPPMSVASAEPMTRSAALAEAQTLNAAFKKNPDDVATAIQFARSLEAMGSNKQAITVLATTADRQPDNKIIVAAYGKSLLSAGRAEEAGKVLKRAQKLDPKDWRVVSALGLANDQMKRYAVARTYYASAAKLAPEESSILNNMGLSYALDKDLVSAEKALRTASEMKGAEPRVRQNLALVVGLQGRFKEAKTIATMDLPKDMAEQNIAYLRNMLAEPNAWRRLANADQENPAAPHLKHQNAIAATPAPAPVDAAADGPFGGPLLIIKSSDMEPEIVAPDDLLRGSTPPGPVIGWSDIFNQKPLDGRGDVVLAARIPPASPRLKSGGVPQ